MQVEGFKCFNEDLTNRYGKKFEVGFSYHLDGNIIFGNSGNGYHMCQNFEDTLRYFDAMKRIVTICAVAGSGTITEAYDDYYGWYNMYAVSDIDIKQKLSRNEIISMALSLPENRVMRFLQLYKLSPIELILFKETFSSSYKVQDCISYYQENDLDTYIKRKEYKNG